MSTKKLAKELGLMRQRSHVSSGSKKTALSNQVFSYLIVIDFESTCWREKNNYGQEIIEFPAVLLNTSTGEVESEFHTYVQPQEHPILSEFCTELTGITQVQVEAGIPLRICLSRFSRWLQNLQHQMGVFFPSRQHRSSEAPPSQKLCTFLTWSDWDLGVCLQYECKRKQIHKPNVLNSWIDLRSTYRLFYNRKPKGLNGALQDLGIQFEGREHSGLDDARNTAHLAARMMRDGCIMKTTRSLERMPLTSKPIFENKTCPTGNTYNKPKLNADKTAAKTPTSKVSLKPCQSLSSTENHGRILNPKECVVEVQNLVSPRTVLGSTAIPLWGRGQRPNTANIPTNLCSSIVVNGTSSCGNNSLILYSTTVGGLLHVPPPNRPLKTGAEAQDVEESVNITVESEDRCGSYDDVVLDGDDVCSITDFEHMSDFNSVCYSDAHSSVAQVTLGKLKNNLIGNKSNSTVSEPRVCSSVPKYVTSKVNHVTKGAKPSPEKPRKAETHTHPIFETKPLAPGKTSTPTTLFPRPQTVITQEKFSIYCDPAHMAAGTISCPPEKNTLSSLSTNTLYSYVTNRSFVPGALKGGLKITSPLCLCGRRAKRQVVSNGGPNQGRWFFCCPVRRSASVYGRIQKGCEFFKWETALIKSSSASSGSSVSLCHFNSTVNCQPTRSSLRKSY